MVNYALPKPTVNKYSYANGSPYWLVACTINGDRYKKKHADELEARADVARIIRQTHGGIDETEYEACRQVLAFIRNHKREDVRSASAMDLVAWAAERYTSPAKLKTMKEYVDDLIELKWKQGRRHYGVIHLERMLKVFVREMGHVPVNGHTAESLEAWCLSKTQGKDTRYGWCKAIKHLFGYLSGTSKKSPTVTAVLPRSPVAHWTRKRDDNEGTKGVAILSVEESKKLIAEAAKSNCQRMFVWMLFTGMRPEETVRFWTDAECGWKCIDLENLTIHLPRRITKTRSPRDIIICPCLLSWLRHYKDHGTFFVKNWTGRYKETRRAVLSSEKLAPDICRHTWHSFMLACGCSFGDLALQAGNSKEVQLKHYLRLIRDKTMAHAYWELTPEKFAGHDMAEVDWKKQRVALRGDAIARGHAKNKAKAAVDLPQRLAA